VVCPRLVNFYDNKKRIFCAFDLADQSP